MSLAQYVNGAALIAVASLRRCAISATRAQLLSQVCYYQREDDGRWFGYISEMPGVMAYGRTKNEAMRNTEILASRVIADRIEHGEMIPTSQTPRTSPR